MALAEIEKRFGGTWVLTKNENLNDYLKEIGIGFLKRIFAENASSTTTISIEGEYVHIITKCPKNQDVRFRLEEEFESTDIQDNPVKVKATYSDGKIQSNIQPIDSKGKHHFVERDIVNGDLIMTIRVNEVVCRRIFKKRN